MNSDEKPSPEEIKKGSDTGLLVEHVDLANQQEIEAKTDPEMLLPHERDETAGPESTQSSGDARSRERIAQAHDDIDHGLEDTDCRGTPSNIFTSGTCSHPPIKKESSD